MEMIYKKGYPFAFHPAACARCSGVCCRGASGRIWVGRDEMQAICRLLRINIIDFMAACTHRADNRYTLKERRHGEEHLCIFFDPDRPGCTVYAARPRQCRAFPFWPPFREDAHPALDECPGIRFVRKPETGG